MKKKMTSTYEAVVAEIRRYLKTLKRYVEDPKADLPDHSRLAQVRCPQSLIIEARAEGHDRFNLGWPFIAATMEDHKAPGEEHNERYFDPWYYMAMLLMEVAGGFFRFDRSKYAGYWFVAYGAEGNTEDPHYVRRLINDTPSGCDTIKAIRMPDDHYDYRRVTLKSTLKRVVRALSRKTRSHSRDREDAMAFAVEQFRQRLSDAGTESLYGLNAAQFEAMLRDCICTADMVYKLYAASLVADAAE